MPRVEIPVTDLARSGVRVDNVTQTVADATNDMYIESNDGRVFIEIENENAGSQTVEVEPNPVPGGQFDGLSIENLVLTIPASQTLMFGPFREYTFAQDSAGMMHLNPSISTDIKFRAFRLPES
jgi:hypothetical protein